MSLLHYLSDYLTGLLKWEKGKVIVLLLKWQGPASHYSAETTFTFHFSILTLSNAFLGIHNREMKKENGFSLAMASQPFQKIQIG